MGNSLWGSVWGAATQAAEAVSNTAAQAAQAASSTAAQAAEAVSNTAVQAAEAMAGAVTGVATAVSNTVTQTTQVTNAGAGVDFETEDERVAFYGALYAIAAVDGSVAPEELNLIDQFIDKSNLLKSTRQQIESYKVQPPLVENCLKQLSNSDQLLQWSLIFYLVQIIYADNAINPEETQVIEKAKKEFGFQDKQLQALKLYIQTLKDISDGKIDINQVVEVTQKVTVNLQSEGVPVSELLALSQTKASGYSDNNFWVKVTDFAMLARNEVIEKALILYYTHEHPNTPQTTKNIIYGALGYFILSPDLVPDFIPGIGLGDDTAVLLTAITNVAMCITPEIREAAKQKKRDWFD